MESLSLSYREVIPDNSSQEDCNEIILNTGGTQSTLQDIKIAERAGGYCFRNVALNHNRNRFIYWRTYLDVLELCEVSLDFNLYQNSVRYKFSDSPVLAVSITEQDRFVTLLVATVCSLHRITFPHPDVLADSSSFGSSASGSGSSSASSAGGGCSIDFNESHTFSIFRDASAAAARDPTTFFVIETLNGATNNPIPHAAITHLSSSGAEAYFSLAFQSHLALFVMNCATGHTTTHHLKEHHMMPRLFSNIKGALTGKAETMDYEQATSLAFTRIRNHAYLMALYRNDQLRVWSVATGQKICSINCSRDKPEKRQQGPQSNLLRRISDTSVCVFLSHATGAEFVCIDMVPVTVGATHDAAIKSAGQGWSLVLRKVISAPQLDLADFEVSATRIWALWSNAEGEFSISSYALVRGVGMNWVSAAMEPPPDRYCIGIEQGMDPREAYCSYIFHPGKFDLNVISKALFMFRRSTVRLEVSHCGMALLKDHVCEAVEEEIQNELKNIEVSDEEYLEMSTRLWERFYSCCEQYHMKAYQPTGLFVLGPIDAVCVIKKSTFSLLRPTETLEHLMLSGDDVDVGIVVPMYFADDQLIGEDLVHLVAMIARLDKWLPEDVKMDLDKKLYQLEMPNVLITRLTDEILAGDPDKKLLPPNFIVRIRQNLQAIRDIRSAMSMLLDILRMDNGNPEAMQTHLGVAMSSRFLMTIGALFGSTVGVSLLSETVRQTAMIRFAICRNLLILQQILIDTYSLPMEVLETLRSQFMPDTVIFLQSYFIMVWIAETPVNLTAATNLESSIQRLSMLQLANGSGRIYSNVSKSHVAPLLRIFLTSKGLFTALALYANNMKSLDKPVWRNTLIPLSTTVCQLIWAVSFNFVFGEWLFSTCQHIIIEDYVRLLNSWCEWNICSRQFILAVSRLDCGETSKAYDLFLQSAKGVLKERFLTTKILKGTTLARNVDDTDDSQLNDPVEVSNQSIAHYYLKVIQLFEQHNAIDHIIAMAQVAIGLLQQNDPQLAMFQSIVFNNHLQLEHYEEAYHSLIYNAEMSRRKDCLRQLVATLFNRKRLDVLMRFPYVGLQDEFEHIVESRARSIAIEENEIYEFLYSFHVNTENMRKASAAMYEQAMRCHLESDLIDSIRKRCSSLLVCINALHLIDERYRWIAKPIIGDNCGAAAVSAANAMTTATAASIKQPEVVVLEIKDIRRELLQSESLLLLADRRNDVHAFFDAGPSELTMILASSGLYTAALKLAQGFGISLLPVYESLTAACVRSGDEDVNEPWSWLQDNDLADLPHRNKAADMAWALLHQLVDENELENSLQIRKCVVNKLLSLYAFVPQWLFNEYKQTNVSELLHLFVKHGRLLEAAELAQEMLSAMLGTGSEYFSFRQPIAVTNRELCLPINTLDLLLHGLKQNVTADDIEYRMAAATLEDMVDHYIQVASRTAEDKIQLEFQKTRERPSLKTE